MCAAPARGEVFCLRRCLGVMKQRERTINAPTAKSEPTVERLLGRQSSKCSLSDLKIALKTPMSFVAGRWIWML